MDTSKELARRLRDAGAVFVRRARFREVWCIDGVTFFVPHLHGGKASRECVKNGLAQARRAFARAGKTLNGEAS